MTRTVLLGAALAGALATAGCMETTLALRDGSAGPAPSKSVAGPVEETVRVFVPETGFVRGTRKAVASFGTPLKAGAGPNRTVEACRTLVHGEAQKLGARKVEAVSAGPHRLTPKGEWVAPVRMRVTYARPDGVEVREATMTCIVDRENRVVDAFG